jgi:hypothetical protein
MYKDFMKKKQKILRPKKWANMHNVIMFGDNDLHTLLLDQ